MNTVIYLISLTLLFTGIYIAGIVLAFKLQVEKGYLTKEEAIWQLKEIFGIGERDELILFKEEEINV